MLLSLSALILSKLNALVFRTHHYNIIAKIMKSAKEAIKGKFKHLFEQNAHLTVINFG